MKYQKLENCRVCNSKIIEIFSLGNMKLSGIFPSSSSELENVPSIPLSLSKCEECNLIQLGDLFDVELLYGETYGYRSGLNESMVNHLKEIVNYIENKIEINENTRIVDIGSNDGTLLNSYKTGKLIGIDPSAKKFREYYKDNVEVITEFFNKYILKEKVKVITSISMFYDLPRPMEFLQNIYDILEDDGIWITEQSYVITMFEKNSFDTICHEHLEYYSLENLKYMCDKVGFKIIDVSFDDTNGGSFRCVMSKNGNESEKVKEILENEKRFFESKYIEDFKNRIEQVRQQIDKFFEKCKEENKIVHGYGASTKGNILLQYFNIDNEKLKYISEVNEYKFSKYSSTGIKIISDSESKKINPDYFFVLPWHFRENILKNEGTSGKLIFPFPNFILI